MPSPQTRARYSTTITASLIPYSKNSTEVLSAIVAHSRDPTHGHLELLDTRGSTDGGESLLPCGSMRHRVANRDAQDLPPPEVVSAAVTCLEAEGQQRHEPTSG